MFLCAVMDYIIFDFYFCIVLYGCFGVLMNEWMNELTRATHCRGYTEN